MISRTRLQQKGPRGTPITLSPNTKAQKAHTTTTTGAGASRPGSSDHKHHSIGVVRNLEPLDLKHWLCHAHIMTPGPLQQWGPQQYLYPAGMAISGLQQKKGKDGACQASVLCLGPCKRGRSGFSRPPSLVRKNATLCVCTTRRRPWQTKLLDRLRYYSRTGGDVASVPHKAPRHPNSNPQQITSFDRHVSPSAASALLPAQCSAMCRLLSSLVWCTDMVGGTHS